MTSRPLFAICGAAAIIILACAARRATVNPKPIMISKAAVVVNVDVPASLANERRAVLHAGEIEVTSPISGAIEVVDSKGEFLGNITFYGVTPHQRHSADFAIANPGHRMSVKLIPHDLETPVKIGSMAVVAASASPH